MPKILILLAAALLLTGCAAVKSQPSLLSSAPKQALATLKHYQLEQPVPEGYGQFQYEDLTALFSEKSSNRSIKLLDVSKDNRKPLPGGFNCQSRTWFMLSIGLAPSVCRYKKVYSLEVHDKDLGISQRHSLSFVETRTLGWFVPLILPLPSWRFDSGSSDNRAVFSLINQAIQSK